MSFVPDKAKVREKMTYASTKGSLKLSLGGGSFSQEYFGTVAVRWQPVNFAYPLTSQDF